MSDDTNGFLSLDVTQVSAGLARAGSLWREVRAVGETGSSNADLLAAAGAGLAEGAVLVAEAQTAGRGRLGRRWASPPRAGLTFSVLLRPVGVPAALRAVAAVDASLKWPNDVLAGEKKLGGILAERTGTAVVIGIGINVWQARADLPPDAAATSLALVAGPGVTGPAADGGAPGLRERLLAGLLDELGRRYLAWRDQASPGDADACGLRQEYARRCATLGREVTVTMPGTEPVTGTATGVDRTGRLEVRTARGLIAVTAGDVVHVRPADEAGH
jgi:BirA family biotin operon repressor/biotin-[acetyl-CoA-carboxylase] ligase